MAAAANVHGPSRSDHNRLRVGLEDEVSGDILEQAVTLVPCGHTFNKDTVIAILKRGGLCPLDRSEIEKYVPNYTVRYLATHLGESPVEDISEEALEHFTKGKEFSDQGNKDKAIESFLKALEISPTYTKAQSYLDCALGISSHPPLQKEVARTKEAYSDFLLRLLDNPLIQQNPNLLATLENALEELMDEETEALTLPQQEMYKWVQKLLVDEKVSLFVSKKLQQLRGPAHRPPTAQPSSNIGDDKDAQIKLLTQTLQRMDQYIQETQQEKAAAQAQANALATAKAETAVKDYIKTRAFGRVQWMEYFGGVGVEILPPLDIIETLQSPCPFWPGKKVEETHMLVFVPETACGKPLSLATLGELIAKPRQGKASQYNQIDMGAYRDAPPRSSHWALITRDIIPNTHGKPYVEQQAELQRLSEIAQVPYSVPNILDSAVSIFMENLRSYKSPSRYDSLTSLSYARCQERYDAQGQICIQQMSDGTITINNQEKIAAQAAATLSEAQSALQTAKDNLERTSNTAKMAYETYENGQKSEGRRDSQSAWTRQLYSQYEAAGAACSQPRSIFYSAESRYKQVLENNQKINPPIGIRAQRNL